MNVYTHLVTILAISCTGFLQVKSNELCEQGIDLNCTFSIASSPNSNIEWKTSLASESSDDYPKVDGTGSSDGHYLYASFKDDFATSLYIESGKLSEDVLGIGFNFYLFGTKLPKLSLQLICDGSSQVIWQKAYLSNTSPLWQFQQVPVEISGINCRLRFEVELNDDASKLHGVVALDTLELLWQVDPSREPPMFSSFETDAENWQLEILTPSTIRPDAKIVEWNKISVDENQFIDEDHTFHSSVGHVIKMSGTGSPSNPESGCFSGTTISNFAIKSPVDYPKQCLSMYARWSTRGLNLTSEIYVHLVDANNSIVATLWSGSLMVPLAMERKQWTKVQSHLNLVPFAIAQKNVLDNSPYRIAIEGVICSPVQLRTAGMVLDDIFYDVNECRINGDDDLEDGEVNRLWTSEPAASQSEYSFIRVPSDHQLSFLKPAFDHTFSGQKQGWVLVSENDLYEISHLYIDMHHVTAPYCLSFFAWTKIEDIKYKTLTIRNFVGAADDDFLEEYKVEIPDNYDEDHWIQVVVPITPVVYAASRVSLSVSLILICRMNTVKCSD